MNRYILIRRLRGPAFLLLVGINALLAQAHILGWGHSWPFYLILAGVFALAERAVITADGGMTPPPYPGGPYPGGPYPGSPYPGAPYPGAPYAGAPTVQTPATESTAIVPAHSHDFDDESNGGRS
jgi:hypothetical protein